MITLKRWLEDLLYGNIFIQDKLKPLKEEQEGTRQLLIMFAGLVALLLSVGWLGIDFIQTPWLKKEWSYSFLLVKSNHLSFYMSQIYLLFVLAMVRVEKLNLKRNFFKRWVGVVRALLYFLIYCEIIFKMTGYSDSFWLLLLRAGIVYIFYLAIPIGSDFSLYKIEPLWLLFYRGCMWWSFSPSNIAYSSSLIRSLNRLLKPFLAIEASIVDGFTLISQRYYLQLTELFFLFFVTWILNKKVHRHVKR